MTNRVGSGHARTLVISAIVVIALATGVVVIATHHANAQTSSSLSSPNSAGNNLGQQSRKPLLRVTSVTPANGAKNVSFSSRIELKFATALNPRSTIPTLAPAIVGRWTRPNAKTLLFTPGGQFVPGTTVTVTLEAGRSGPLGENGARLKTQYSTTFDVAAGTVLRVQQLLAELGYLPYSFAPTGPGAAAHRAAHALTKEPKAPDQISRNPERGSFVVRFSSIPAQLAATFTPGQVGATTQAAVMTFEAAHNLAVDGEIGTKVWGALLAAVAARQPNPRPYDYLIVSQTLPETLYAWRNGSVVYQTPANTGVDGVTPDGTWPVFLKFLVTTMTGTNPDGTSYVDPGIPWVSYFHDSDAVHGFPRATYGWPQSAGCIEIPIANAANVYPMDPVGTLVTVTTGDLSPELHAPAPAYSTPPAPPSTSTTSTTSTTTTTTTVPPKRHRSPSTTTTTVPATTTTTVAPPTTTTVPATSTTTATI